MDIITDSLQVSEKKLQKLFGFSHFHENQWSTIRELFKGNRVLLIEKTGFGKSLCFQYPATQFDGVTIVFSPLIALMRDQVDSLNKKGIKSALINSEITQNQKEKALEDAKSGKIKILYIAPERQESIEWMEAVRNIKISMIVIDEAHTISVWGHDFRPAFRRIVNLVKLLPANMPVLATTATATKIVQKDIEEQLSGGLKTIRGNLLRDNFRLFVIKVKSEEEKFIWLSQKLMGIPGSGIIYTGTRSNTAIYSMWLNKCGIESISYNSKIGGMERKRIEKGLMNNDWKCIVSTNALGMGIDKPDIRFIIHTQIPESPIHYYQEIGRAGRDGDPAYLILFFNESKEGGMYADEDLPRAFIESSKPEPALYQKVIELLKNNFFERTDLLKVSNLRDTQIRVILADLVDQGVINEIRVGRKVHYGYNSKSVEFDFSFFDELRNRKLNELKSMLEYVETDMPRMQFLCNYLGDEITSDHFNCDNTKYSKREVEYSEEELIKVKEFQKSIFPVIETTVSGTALVDGIAASYYRIPSVGKILHNCKYENGGDYTDFLLMLVLKAIRKHYSDEKFDLIFYVPPSESGDLVKNFAINISKALKIEISHSLQKLRSSKPQKIFKNFVLKNQNVAGIFCLVEPPDLKGKRVLLIDDIYDSGSTIKEIGKLLSGFGAELIAPVVIAKTQGGDI